MNAAGDGGALLDRPVLDVSTRVALRAPQGKADALARWDLREHDPDRPGPLRAFIPAAFPPGCAGRVRLCMRPRFPPGVVEYRRTLRTPRRVVGPLRPLQLSRLSQSRRRSLLAPRLEARSLALSLRRGDSLALGASRRSGIGADLSLLCCAISLTARAGAPSPPPSASRLASPWPSLEEGSRPPFRRRALPPGLGFRSGSRAPARGTRGSSAPTMASFGRALAALEWSGRAPQSDAAERGRHNLTGSRPFPAPLSSRDGRRRFFHDWRSPSP